MTDDELDEFFISLLKTILADMKDCDSFLSNPKNEEDKEIKEDYAFVIGDLSKVLKSIKTIDDLAEMDAETIDNVYSYIEAYAENFVISAENPQKQKDLDYYKKIEEIMNLFLDDEDFEDEEI